MEDTKELVTSVSVEMAEVHEMQHEIANNKKPTAPTKFDSHDAFHGRSSGDIVADPEDLRAMLSPDSPHSVSVRSGATYFTANATIVSSKGTETSEGFQSPALSGPNSPSGGFRSPNSPSVSPDGHTGQSGLTPPQTLRLPVITEVHLGDRTTTSRKRRKDRRSAGVGGGVLLGEQEDAAFEWEDSDGEDEVRIVTRRAPETFGSPKEFDSADEEDRCWSKEGAEQAEVLGAPGTSGVRGGRANANKRKEPRGSEAVWMEHEKYQLEREF